MGAIRYFGTDGIRGRVGEDVINPEFILKLGWAVGMVLGEEFGDSKVLIGKDTRISGYLLESVLEAGLSSAGVDAWMLGPVPTPGVSYLTRTLRAQVGIVISASHNPYYDNGIKFFSSEGTKLSDRLELEIEEQLHKPMKLVDAARLGKAKRITDARGRYIEFCKSTLGINSSLSGLKIVVDCANGATYQIAPAVLRELGAVVIEIGTSPDGFNINYNCGSTSPKILAERVVKEQADLGVGFDGDGDRVIMIDHKGEVVDGDDILYIIAKKEVDSGRLSGGVVGTIMSNAGLELGLNELGIDFKRTKVGDRYVIEELRANGWLLGGEPCGHIAHLGLTSTGDGIVCALQALSAVYDSGKSLHELRSSIIKYPQVLINVECDFPKKVFEDPRIEEGIAKASSVLGKSGRVLLRPSGTEPVVRVMVEGDKLDLVSELAEELAEIVRGSAKICEHTIGTDCYSS